MPHKTDLPANLLSLKTLTKNNITQILQLADHLLTTCVQQDIMLDTLKGKIIANLFFEPSTRTRNSFEIAAKRLGAFVLNPDFKTSSLNKGESLLDTVQTLAAMGVGTFIIRHAENGVPKWLAEQLPSNVFINAGDGHHQHPTQGLIDLLTIQQHKADWASLQVTIIGDIFHSRVANSLIDGLLTMGVAEIRLAGPPTLLPDDLPDDRIKIFPALDQSLKDSDVIVTLRVQKERIQKGRIPDLNTFHQEFGLTAERLKLAKPDAIVMHPGPMNREVEIASAVADGKQAVILQQVRNGIAIRMAVLDLLA